MIPAACPPGPTARSATAVRGTRRDGGVLALKMRSEYFMEMRWGCVGPIASCTAVLSPVNQMSTSGSARGDCQGPMTSEHFVKIFGVAQLAIVYGNTS